MKGTDENCVGLEQEERAQAEQLRSERASEANVEKEAARIAAEEKAAEVAAQKEAARIAKAQADAEEAAKQQVLAAERAKEIAIKADAARKFREENRQKVQDALKGAQEAGRSVQETGQKVSQLPVVFWKALGAVTGAGVVVAALQWVYAQLQEQARRAADAGGRGVRVAGLGAVTAAIAAHIVGLI
ncbi:hypothetical protein CYMTET_26360 [Cymbomonas tetramitiformis]|uniref:Uncharacterized protein n=1 Tax=Cymbomonas tetramitiformis TaxID=36881 RepID=A0AAE0FSG4_9CHLO|nr:hypothetical protein CYMTET_26360 [Cymbomonas tetramitiformis]